MLTPLKKRYLKRYVAKIFNVTPSDIEVTYEQVTRTDNCQIAIHEPLQALLFLQSIKIESSESDLKIEVLNYFDLHGEYPPVVELEYTDFDFHDVGIMVSQIVPLQVNRFTYYGYRFRNKLASQATG